MKIKKAVFPFTLLLLCIAVLPNAQAVNPPPDGGYPGFNTAEGTNALKNLTTGVANTAVGWFSLLSNIEGDFNTATGTGSLLFNTADQNTAFGAAALLFNSTGAQNTAVGAAALLNNTDGNANTANGASALVNNTTGAANTANGVSALFFNTEGSANTANGSFALQNNATGNNNTAIGYGALLANTIGSDNTAIGYHASWSTETGDSNTAIGRNALAANGGSQNTAIGVQALENNTSGNNTAIGYLAGSNNTSGNQNTALGAFAGLNVSTADNVICINVSGDNVSESCYIGNIWQQPGGTQAVYVNSNGKLGAQVSSQRFKDEIKEMEQASEVIYGLKPVSFRYKPEIEPTRPLGFGLIAEDVEKISPDLVIRDREGKPQTVRYEQINAMLLNEFLKEHRKVENLEKEMTALTARLEEQAAQIQKVSAQVELNRGAPRTVLNNP